MLDEMYHSTWFNESRRIESVKAHTALGGRLVHGCQSVPNQSGGACVLAERIRDAVVATQTADPVGLLPRAATSPHDGKAALSPGTLACRTTWRTWRLVAAEMAWA